MILALVAIAPSLVGLAFATPPPPPGGIVADPCAPSVIEALKDRDWRLYDWSQSCRYAAANRALAEGNRPVRAVFLGDSITEGWPENDPALFADGIVGRGIGGQTSPQMLVRFRQDVIALKPAAVHIMAGTNDIAGNSGPTTLEAVEDHIRSMAELAHASGIRVIIGSVLPAERFGWSPNRRPATQIADLNRRLKRYAASRNFVYADYHAALANERGGLNPADAEDGVHPTRAGYAKMRAVADQALAAALR